MPVKAKRLNDSVASLLQATIKHDVSDRLVDTWVPSILWYEACLKSPLMSSYQGIFMEEGKLKFKHASLMSTPTMHPIYLDKVDRFNRAVNKTGVFKVTHGRKTYLFVTRKHDFTPERPCVNVQWTIKVDEDAKKIGISMNRYATLWSSSLLNDRNTRQRIESEQTNHADNQTVDGGNGASSGSGFLEDREEEQNGENNNERKMPATCFWESLEVRNFFGTRDEDTTVKDTLCRKIDVLGTANGELDGYKEVIEDGDQKKNVLPLTSTI